MKTTKNYKLDPTRGGHPVYHPVYHPVRLPPSNSIIFMETPLQDRFVSIFSATIKKLNLDHWMAQAVDQTPRPLGPTGWSLTATKNLKTKKGSSVKWTFYAVESVECLLDRTVFFPLSTKQRRAPDFEPKCVRLMMQTYDSLCSPQVQLGIFSGTAALRPRGCKSHPAQSTIQTLKAHTEQRWQGPGAVRSIALDGWNTGDISWNYTIIS